MKFFHMISFLITIIHIPVYSLTTKISDVTASEIFDVASDSINRIEAGRVYFKPNAVQIIDSEIYIECACGYSMPIPIIESMNRELFITLSSPEKVVYECTKCGKKYYPNPPARCSCGSTSFKSKIDVLP